MQLAPTFVFWMEKFQLDPFSLYIFFSSSAPQNTTKGAISERLCSQVHISYPTMHLTPVASEYNQTNSTCLEQNSDYTKCIDDTKITNNFEKNDI